MDTQRWRLASQRTLRALHFCWGGLARAWSVAGGQAHVTERERASGQGHPSWSATGPQMSPVTQPCALTLCWSARWDPG